MYDKPLFKGLDCSHTSFKRSTNSFCLSCNFFLPLAVVGGSSPRVSQVVPVIQARNIEVCQGGLIQAPKWNDRCGGIITVEAEGQ